MDDKNNQWIGWLWKGTIKGQNDLFPWNNAQKNLFLLCLLNKFKKMRENKKVGGAIG